MATRSAAPLPAGAAGDGGRALPARGRDRGDVLSGGLDSSLVVALARRLHDAPLRTYSVSFGAEYPNELAFSSLVAAHCGTEHRIVELSPAAVVQHLDDVDRPAGRSDRRPAHGAQRAALPRSGRRRSAWC